MEPQVQYAKTTDGVNIAFGVAGSGPALVYVRTWAASHVQLDWQLWKFYEALAARRTLITFDRRGAGLSDRGVSELTLEKFTLDLEAVVNHLGLERFALMGFQMGMMVSTIYALRHPERVAALISLGGVISGGAVWQSPRNRALRAMREADFDTWVETMAAMSGDPRLNEIWRASVTPEGHQAFVDAIETFDVTGLVSQLNLPVLLLHSADGPDSAERGAFAREMATRIPGARLVALPGEPPEAFAQGVAIAVEAFLSDAPAPPAASPSGVHTILFTDIADSTALTERLGDAAFRQTAKALDDRLRAVIREAGGTPVEGRLLGDGLMAVFASARESIEAAQRCNVLSGESELRLRIGVHAGDVIREEGNIFGGAVNIASRVADAASPGEVLVSATVRDLARTSAGVSFEDRGERELKGVGEPVRLFAVREG